MLRDFINELVEWKNQPFRKPLILKGARQVGKSWIVQEFGKSFPSFVEINFEKDKSAGELFSGDIRVLKILERLSLYTGKKISPGQTLLFLDEAQECEDAIRVLRYFKEELPELHVVAAGSLIDFVLDKIGLPVGRVQFLHLYPLSFGEFLVANGRDDLRRHILSCDIIPAIHLQLLEMLRTYMWLGGMPAVVDAWIKRSDWEICQSIQDEIIGSYKQDFAKYARRRQIEHVERVFMSVPLQLGNKFKYAAADPHLRSGQIKEALLLLEKAGILLVARHSSGQGVPLGATVDERKFKAFFFDIGLAQRMLGLNLKEWVLKPLKVINVGAIAEQLAAQEFAAYSAPTSATELYYWQRESPGSNAEIDMLAVKDSAIVPVEVKSGVKGGLKSMHVFLQSHPSSKYGVKISEMPFSSHGQIQEIPLYGIEAWLKSSLPRNLGT